MARLCLIPYAVTATGGVVSSMVCTVNHIIPVLILVHHIIPVLILLNFKVEGRRLVLQEGMRGGSEDDRRPSIAHQTSG